MSGFIVSYPEGNIVYQRTSVTANSATYQGRPVDNPKFDLKRFPVASDARWVCFPSTFNNADVLSLTPMSEDAQTGDFERAPFLSFKTHARPFIGDVDVSVFGTVGPLSIKIERCRTDPTVGRPDWQTIVQDLKIDPAKTYSEGFNVPGPGWWRVSGILDSEGGLNSSLRVVIAGEQERIVAPYMVARFRDAEGIERSIRRHYAYGTSREFASWGMSPFSPMRAERAAFITEAFAALHLAQPNQTGSSFFITLQTFDEFGAPLDAPKTISAS